MEKEKINGLLLLEKRKKNKWKQEEIAKRAGVSRATVVNWETGKTVPNDWTVVQHAYLLSATELLAVQGREEKKTKNKTELPPCCEELWEKLRFDSDMCDLFMVLLRDNVLDKVSEDSTGKCIPDGYFFEYGRNKAKILVAYEKLYGLKRLISSQYGIYGPGYFYHENWLWRFLDAVLTEHPYLLETGFSCEDMSYDDLKWLLFPDYYLDRYNFIVWKNDVAKFLTMDNRAEQKLDWVKQELVHTYHHSDEPKQYPLAEVSLLDAFRKIADIGISGKCQSVLFLNDDGTATIIDDKDLVPPENIQMRMEALTDKAFVHGSAVPSEFVQIEFRSIQPAWETWCELKKTNPQLPEPRLGSCEIWNTLTPKGLEVFGWLERNNLLSYF